MNRKQPEATEPEGQETPPEETPPEPETPSVRKSSPASTPASEPSAPTASHATEAEIQRVLSAVQNSAKLQVQNLELTVSRVQQMADSQESLYKAHQEALAVLKTSADLMQESIAQLNEKVELLVTVSAALLRYSQEQAAMIASGGGQAQQ